jgi:hypothetical protein
MLTRHVAEDTYQHKSVPRYIGINWATCRTHATTPQGMTKENVAIGTTKEDMWKHMATTSLAVM